MESVIGQQTVTHRRKPLRIVPARYGFVAKARNGNIGGKRYRLPSRPSPRSAQPAGETPRARASSGLRAAALFLNGLVATASVSLRDRLASPLSARITAPRLPAPRILAVITAACALAAALAVAGLGAARAYPRLDAFTLPEDAAIAPFLLSSISPAPAAEESAALPELPLTLTFSSYTIAARDTLDAIARRFNVRLDTLISLNGIRDARNIRAGSILKIPNIDGIAHIVAKGESLGSIAAGSGVSVLDLVDANDLTSQTIKPGQTLFIPGARLSSYDLKRALGTLITWPVNGRISSYFGYRPNPFTGVRQFHWGLDLVVPENSAARAAMDGRVAETGYSALYGNFVIISHPGSYQTLYAHLNKILVRQGAAIRQGETLGLVGNTGYSTAAHLHFGVFKAGVAIDPLKFLKS